HPQQAMAAIDVLRVSGWRARREFSEAWLIYEHATELQDGEGHPLDLHWRVMWEGRRAVSDDEFWEGAQILKIGKTETRALNPTDQLLHVCVHGANWDVIPPVRWVADAMTVMSRSTIDWPRLIEQAKKRELSLVMSKTLGYLKRLLDAPVPDDVLETLNSMRPSSREKLFFQTRTSSQTAIRRLPVLWRWMEGFCATRGVASQGRVVNLVRYFQSLWRLDHLWQVPLHVIYKAARGSVGIPYWYLRNRLLRRSLNIPPVR
ncbi:MAG TPA: nucleotidyltransferase family protein, partial [Pyrinomonadaceae bacterium]|nr:nucleotidyltransferase family protein [Pyrinomonadaceae bacterium]